MTDALIGILHEGCRRGPGFFCDNAELLFVHYSPVAKVGNGAFDLLNLTFRLKGSPFDALNFICSKSNSNLRLSVKADLMLGRCFES